MPNILPPILTGGWNTPWVVQCLALAYTLRVPASLICRCGACGLRGLWSLPLTPASSRAHTLCPSDKVLLLGPVSGQQGSLWQWLEGLQLRNLSLPAKAHLASLVNSTGAWRQGDVSVESAHLPLRAHLHEHSPPWTLECDCLMSTSTASPGEKKEKEKGGRGAPGNQKTSSQEPKKKGTWWQFADFILMPRGSLASITASQQKFCCVCLAPLWPRGAIQRQRGDLLLSGCPKSSIVWSTEHTLTTLGANTSHGPSYDN